MSKGNWTPECVILISFILAYTPLLTTIFKGNICERKSVMKCAVKFCTNVKGKVSGKNFFRFPTDVRLSKIWMEFCQRNKEFKTKNACICVDHFNVNCFANELKINMGYATRRRLKHGSIPTIITQQAASEEQETCDPVLRETSSNHSCDEGGDKENSIIAFGITDAQSQNFENELRDPFENMVPVASSIQTNLQNQIEVLSKNIRLLQRTQNNFRKEIRKFKESSAQSWRKLQNDLKIMGKRFQKIEYGRENVKRKLKTIFTEGQVNNLQNPAKRSTWTEEDIAQSIKLYATSSKAYKLLYKKGLPLPAVRTLHHRAKKNRRTISNNRTITSTQMTTID